MPEASALYGEAGGGGGGAGAEAATDCTSLVVGGPPATVVVGDPPSGDRGSGAGAEAATPCIGPVVGGPPGTVVEGPGSGGTGAEAAAGPPILLGIIDVGVEVVLVRGEAGPKTKLLLGPPPGILIPEVGTLAGKLGGTGTEIPTPKRRLEEPEGDGTTGVDEAGRGGVTGGGERTGGTEDGTLTDGEGGGALGVDDTVAVTEAGDGGNDV
ncbi:hypothetical protein PMAA_047080 [Talaromyces marneffei ATCC 18224]|uniref:Uncharacterized protein n=1 Tax=Talaromyces marneffei (strain ATCC 18224 / CBS 334.59 / QM 7333) TaxID=441960 RepID=B6QNX2_TALMQ|nr:hypothetical protein PMAA_047080 [Talaromyces marneffei ATCC 18224]